MTDPWEWQKQRVREYLTAFAAKHPGQSVGDAVCACGHAMSRHVSSPRHHTECRGEPDRGCGCHRFTAPPEVPDELPADWLDEEDP